jgi:hypothetical protein
MGIKKRLFINTLQTLVKKTNVFAMPLWGLPQSGSWVAGAARFLNSKA